MRWMLAVLVVAVLAGCVSADDSGDGTTDDAATPYVDAAGNLDHQAIAAAIGEPVVLDHDHNDAAAHVGAFHLEQVAYSDLGITLGDNGFANFVIHESATERIAAVAVDGDSDGGFVLVDIADLANLTVLGTYWTAGNSMQEVRISPDGNWAVLNMQDIPTQGYVSELPGSCSVCLHVVDISDRTNPTWFSATPVELLGSHNMEFHTIGGVDYLFAVAQPLSVSSPDVAGNHVWVYQFRAGVLTPVSYFGYYEGAGRSFPHDVLVQPHPDGRTLAYVSHWDGGAVIFDVSNPLGPALEPIAVADDAAPSQALAIHWFMQEPAARNGSTYAWSAPEIGSLASGTGVIRGYDVTVPENLQQISTWTLPGNLSIEGQYRLSPHTTIANPEMTLLAVAHYHAGVWILDISDPLQPRHVAYYFPTGPADEPYDGPLWWKKPNFNPEGYGPNAYQARWLDGKLLVTDRGTGFYVLEYTGPMPA